VDAPNCHVGDGAAGDGGPARSWRKRAVDKSAAPPAANRQAVRVDHPSAAELAAALAHIRAAPADVGRVELLVRRPAVNEREVLLEAELNCEFGVVGDTWNQRRSARTPDGSPHPDMQLNVMSARAAAAVAGPPGRWPLAGDQLFLDLDLSETNLPPGTRLEMGSAVIEVTAQPHTGCVKFKSRFGPAALRFVGTPEGLALRLRGLNARVVQPGTVRPGDIVHKRPPG
jgi:hypothetical protein